MEKALKCCVGPAELTAPGFAWRSGALGASVYYLLVHILQQFTPKEGKALVTSVFIAHGLLSDLLGRPLDFTEPIAAILHTVTNIPKRPGDTQVAKPGANGVKKAPAESKKGQ